MGVVVNTVSGAGGLARGPVRMLRKGGVDSFVRNASSNIGMGAGMTPILHETRDFAQGIAQGDLSKTMENAGWLVAYGTPVGGVGSGLGKVGWAAAQQ